MKYFYAFFAWLSTSISVYSQTQATERYTDIIPNYEIVFEKSINNVSKDSIFIFDAINMNKVRIGLLLCESRSLELLDYKEYIQNFKNISANYDEMQKMYDKRVDMYKNYAEDNYKAFQNISAQFDILNTLHNESKNQGKTNTLIFGALGGIISGLIIGVIISN